MIVSKYSLSNSSEWDNLIDNSLNGTFILKRKYLEYHKDRFNECSTIIKNNGVTIAIFPANINDNNDIISHEGLTYGSLIIDKKIKPLEYLSCFKELLFYYNNLGFKKIIYKSVPKYYYAKHSSFESYILFLINSELCRMDLSSVINLKNDYEFDKRKKRGIKKSKGFDLQIIRNDLLEVFWDQILSTNLEEKFKVKPVHSINEIKYLQLNFPKNILFYGVLFENNLVAGTILFIKNKVAHAQYIAANEIGKKLCALDFLFSELILDELDEIDYLSLGISNENNGKDLNIGLLNWKQGFGSEIFQNDFHIIDTNNYFLLENKN